MGSQVTQAAFGRSAGRQLPFSEGLDRIEDVPPVFRAQLAARFGAIPPRAIIHTPRFDTFGLCVDENLLAIGDDFWWAAFATDDVVRLCEARFSETRLATFSQLLLHGELRLDSGDPASSCVIAFNMVVSDLFRAVVRMVLDGFPEPFVPAARADVMAESVDALSFKLRSALQESAPSNGPLLGLASWQAAESGRRARDPAPAGLLAATARCLFAILDALPPREGQPHGSFDRWGKVVTYVNRGFPVAWTLSSVEYGSELCLLIGHGRAASVRIGLPSAAVLAVERLLERLHEPPAPTSMR